jgi:hypothetical protein
MRRCPYCLKELNGGSKHIYHCSTDKPMKEIKFEYISFNFPEISSEDKLKDIYCNQILSLTDIRKMYGIDFKSTIFLLDYFKIPKRSISESAVKISTPKQRKKLMKKYGVDWSSKLDFVKEKKRQTNLYKHGVDNIWKSDWFKKNRDRFFLEKYGMSVSEYNKNHWDNMSEENQRKHMLNSAFKSSTESSIEIVIKKILDIMCIEYVSQFTLRSDKSIFFFDIKIGDILIEVNGDFWHGNPLIYKSSDFLKFPKKEVMCENLWKKDINKKNIALNKGYKVVYLWESFIKNSSYDELINTLGEILIENKLYDRNYGKSTN